MFSKQRTAAAARRPRAGANASWSAAAARQARLACAAVLHLLRLRRGTAPAGVWLVVLLHLLHPPLLLLFLGGLDAANARLALLVGGSGASIMCGAPAIRVAPRSSAQCAAVGVGMATASAAPGSTTAAA